MKNTYRLFVLACAFVPLATYAASLSFVAGGESTVLKDVSTDAWYADDVKAVAETGIMQGYRNSAGELTGEFGPANPVTRAEFLKMVAVMMIFRYTFDRTTVVIDDPWYQIYLDIVQLEDPELSHVMPIDHASLNQPILRQEAAGLLHLSLGNYGLPLVEGGYPHFPDVDAETPSYKAIAELEYYGVIIGDGETKMFNPFRTLNRAEAAKMLVTTSKSYQTPLGDFTIRLRADCESSGGTWKQWFMLPRGSCNYPTLDAGKACSDSDQCETKCIADEEGIGKCNEWRYLPGGCYSFVEDGKEQPMMCID